MDGVITNTMPDHFHAWKTVLKEEGIDVTHHDVYSREGQKGINSVREIFGEYGKIYSKQKGAKILRKKEILFQSFVKQRFIIGARTFIKEMSRQGFQLALVTGTSRHELKKILPPYLCRYFSVIITGNDVKHGKPHPEPYRLALRKLRMKANDAIVIENAPFGITSAKEAGLKCLALETSLSKQYLKQANRIYHSINDLKKKVKFVVK